jgi:excisionase family DNA binding protein
MKVAWVYERTAAGTIPVHRIGNLLRFRLSEIDTWAESGTAAAR